MPRPLGVDSLRFILNHLTILFPEFIFYQKIRVYYQYLHDFWKLPMPCENDVVLIYFEDKPAAFARIESIEPDIKKDWYNVTLLLLTIPMQTVTWILRNAYIDGAPFTMGGRPVRLEEVKRAKAGIDQEDLHKSKEEKEPGGAGTVIPFKRR